MRKKAMGQWSKIQLRFVFFLLLGISFFVTQNAVLAASIPNCCLLRQAKAFATDNHEDKKNSLETSANVTCRVETPVKPCRAVVTENPHTDVLGNTEYTLFERELSQRCDLAPTMCDAAAAAAMSEQFDQDNINNEVRKDKDNPWSCLLTFDAAEYEENGKNTRCLDLKDGENVPLSAAGNAEQAKKYCGGYCDGKWSVPLTKGRIDSASQKIRPQTCVFKTSEKCLNAYELQINQGPDHSGRDFDSIPSFDYLQQFKVNTIPGLIGLAIKTAMGLIGTIAFAMVIYGGLLWMTARGNSDQHGKALKIIAWAALGVIVILTSYTIVDFVLGSFL